MDPIEPIPTSITFAVLLTAAGTGIAAGIITTLVAIIARVMPTIYARISGALLAFVLSAVLYVLAAIAVGVNDLDQSLVVFVAWLTCATAAIGVDQVAFKGALTGGVK